jgi:hypothetical protein
MLVLRLFTYLAVHGGAGTCRLCLRHSLLPRASDSDVAEADLLLLLLLRVVLAVLMLLGVLPACLSAASTHGKQSQAVVCASWE